MFIFKKNIASSSLVWVGRIKRIKKCLQEEVLFICINTIRVEFESKLSMYENHVRNLSLKLLPFIGSSFTIKYDICVIPYAMITFHVPSDSLKGCMRKISRPL